MIVFLILGQLGFCQEKPILRVKEKVDVLDDLAREPMLAEHPNGDLYVAGYRNAGMIPQLWRSKDLGKSWERVDVGTLEDGADGNSDVDLVIDEDGTIYFLTMKYTRIPKDTTGFDWDMKGEHIAVGISMDEGLNWDWQYLSQNELDDRPWIVIDSEGSAHVIWNDGNGVHYRTSRDKGVSWEQQQDISPKGGSSHFAAGPNGQLAVRISSNSASGRHFDAGLDLMMISTDNGQTWDEVQPPGTRIWNANYWEGTPRWVEPVAWDMESNLYYVWSEGKMLKLGVSENDGKDWKVFVVASSEDIVYYPYLSIKHGLITCSWIAGFENDIKHHAAVIRMNEEEILVQNLESQTLRDVRSRFSEDEILATGGEYFPILPLSDGDIGMVTTIQNYVENRLGFTWWRLATK